jgi:hypothetical protein
MKRQTFRAVLFILILLLALTIHLSVASAAKSKPLPYKFNNANVYYQRGKTYIEWYNADVGKYSIYEYRYVKQDSGNMNLEPIIVWSSHVRVGNMKVQFLRKGIRWKVIYSGP